MRSLSSILVNQELLKWSTLSCTEESATVSITHCYYQIVCGVSFVHISGAFGSADLMSGWRLFREGSFVLHPFCRSCSVKVAFVEFVGPWRRHSGQIPVHTVEKEVCAIPLFCDPVLWRHWLNSICCLSSLSTVLASAYSSETLSVHHKRASCQTS